VIDLARGAGIPLVEADLDLFDVRTADEAFLTSTSLCICPVRSVNGVAIGAGSVPGPVTRRLTEAYCRLVDFDFVAQYLKRLEG
jgi:branched-chain amino acid aminotransferase